MYFRLNHRLLKGSVFYYKSMHCFFSILPSIYVLHTIIINKDISNNHFLTENNKVTLEIETKLNLKQNKNQTKQK